MESRIDLIESLFGEQEFHCHLFKDAYEVMIAGEAYSLRFNLYEGIDDVEFHINRNLNAAIIFKGKVTSKQVLIDNKVISTWSDIGALV